jgi:hypothetical protein
MGSVRSEACLGRKGADFLAILDAFFSQYGTAAVRSRALKHKPEENLRSLSPISKQEAALAVREAWVAGSTREIETPKVKVEFEDLAGDCQLIFFGQGSPATHDAAMPSLPPRAQCASGTAPLSNAAFLTDICDRRVTIGRVEPINGLRE